MTLRAIAAEAAPSSPTALRPSAAIDLRSRPDEPANFFRQLQPASYLKPE
jgi:hypothetical protein